MPMPACRPPVIRAGLIGGNSVPRKQRPIAVLQRCGGWITMRAVAREEQIVRPDETDVLLVVDVQNDFCPGGALAVPEIILQDRKSTRLNSSHPSISYAVFCLKKKKKTK